jgi:hypothetical protein
MLFEVGHVTVFRGLLHLKHNGCTTLKIKEAAPVLTPLVQLSTFFWCRFRSRTPGPPPNSATCAFRKIICNSVTSLVVALSATLTCPRHVWRWLMSKCDAGRTEKLLQAIALCLAKHRMRREEKNSCGNQRHARCHLAVSLPLTWRYQLSVRPFVDVCLSTCFLVFIWISSSITGRFSCPGAPVAQGHRQGIPSYE